MRRPRRRVIGGLATLAAAGLMSSCSLGLEQLPAPSGTTGPTYTLTAQFTDVQNLALGAKVKLGGVVVGEVMNITTHAYRAAVVMHVEKKFPLGTDAHFQIRFTTPLGEDFISITSKGTRGRLTDGATVPLEDTSDAPGIEDTFAALSTLLNGGGLDKLRIIAGELDIAFKGRTSSARAALINLHTVIADLDQHKTDIDHTLDGLGQLARTLNKGTPVIEQALQLFPSTLQTLADDTVRIRTLLQRVGALGTTVDGLLQRSQSALLADFDNLRPTLDALRARQRELLPTFRSLIAVGQAVNRAAPGDYLNVAATVQFLLEAPPARPTKGGIIHSGAEPADAAIRALLGAGGRS